MRGIWILVLLSLLTFPARGQDRLESTVNDGVRWYEIGQLDVEGRAFDDLKSPYDRLPARAEGVVREAVWSLSRDSAGMCVRFVTDATTLHARWTLVSSRLAMPHMPATGVSGLDLYAKTAEGQWRWLAVGRPTKFPTNSARLATGIKPGRREYLLYLPLYNGVTSVEIGVPAGAAITRADPHPAERAKPIVFYGTSITHGACASRPGMVHTAIVSRRLHVPVVNLGFSGNGRMEPEVATLMAEIDASVFVIDCLPNIRAEQVAERTEPLVAILRERHPTTPIVLVEGRNYTDGIWIAAKRRRNVESQAALEKAYAALKGAGDENLHYIHGDDLLGHDGEGAVDSSHPNDLGFMRQAEEFLKVLRPLFEHDTAR